MRKTILEMALIHKLIICKEIYIFPEPLSFVCPFHVMCQIKHVRKCVFHFELCEKYSYKSSNMNFVKQQILYNCHKNIIIHIIVSFITDF